MMKLFVSAVMLLMFFGSCNNSKGKVTQVIVKPTIELNSVIYLKKLGYNGNKDVIIDSIIYSKLDDSLVFNIKDEQSNIYRLTSPHKGLKAMFINDAPVIHISANFLTNKYKVRGSESENQLKRFTTAQEELAMSNRLLIKQIDSLKNAGVSQERYKPLKDKYNADFARFFDRYITFADTVKNPALLMRVFNFLEFGNDHKRQKQFMQKALKRFPGYKPLRELNDEIMQNISIYEQEFIVGDKLPSITLPDANNVPFNTATLKGKYYLIDFWSTFCQSCLTFKRAELAVAGKMPFTRFQIVSVALDDQRDVWTKMTSKPHNGWTHLIDERMWRGTAVRTLKFDSIPFNFLVSPDGKVLKKAITADSLQIVLKELKL